MFGKKKEEMMVYVIMGFLEAGKTNLIRDLVVDDMFDDKIKTMILACEEGELEYEPDVLEKANCVVEYIEDEEAFNGKIIQKFLKKHRPDRIIIEYNGMWPTKHIPELYDDMEEICFDREVIFQTIDVVNDETFALYMKNMPSMMVDQFRVAEMIIINRCTVEKTNKNSIRGSIKAVNPRAQIVYESAQDEFYEMKENVQKYIETILSKNMVEILDIPTQIEQYKGEIINVLDMMINYFRDIMICKEHVNKSMIINADKLVFIQNMSSKITYSQVSKIIDIIEDTKIKIKGNCNFNVSIQVMSLNIYEVIK